MNILKTLYVALIQEALASSASLRLSAAEGAGHAELVLEADGTVIIDGTPAFGVAFESFLTMPELAALAVKAEAILPNRHAVGDSAEDWRIAAEPDAEQLAARCNQLASAGLTAAATHYLVTGAPLQVCGDKAALEAAFVLTQIGLAPEASGPREHMQEVFRRRLGYAAVT